MLYLGINFNYTKVLHGEQYIEQYKPIPPGEGELRAQVKLIDILDKGVGALIITEGKSCTKEILIFIFVIFLSIFF